VGSYALIASQAPGFAILTGIGCLEVFARIVPIVSHALPLRKIALLSCARHACIKDSRLRSSLKWRNYHGKRSPEYFR